MIHYFTKALVSGYHSLSLFRIIAYQVSLFVHDSMLFNQTFKSISLSLFIVY